MGQAEKSHLYRSLKADGWVNDKHFREYSTEDLQKIAIERAAIPPVEKTLAELADEQTQQETGTPPPPPVEAGAPPQPTMEELLAQRAAVASVYERILTGDAPPVMDRDPAEFAGQRLNTQSEDEPIRTDEQGRIWFQEEVMKAAYAKPRGRRVLKYLDPGVKEETIHEKGDGNFQETFEVAGDRAIASEAKITLPSYQVGIYKDRRFPFKIHCYNSLEGFDYFEVNDYWGGEAFVPEGCKRIYVENVLCYDIRSTVAVIQMEDRQLQLASGRGMQR